MVGKVWRCEGVTHNVKCLMCCCCCWTYSNSGSKMVGSFSRAFGGCRANFSKFRSSHAKFAFNKARTGPRRKVYSSQCISFMLSSHMGNCDIWGLLRIAQMTCRLSISRVANGIHLYAQFESAKCVYHSQELNSINSCISNMPYTFL